MLGASRSSAIWNSDAENVSSMGARMKLKAVDMVATPQAAAHDARTSRNSERLSADVSFTPHTVSHPCEEGRTPAGAALFERCPAASYSPTQSPAQYHRR